MSDASRFDYIIVGAGSAGCILASRLSENPTNRVLLLEAGDRDRNPLFHIPMGVAKIWNNPRYNWSYHSEPQKNVDNRELFHPHGKVVGGSGSINMAAFVRGNRADYDGWAQRGLLEWSYDRVLPYFKKMESFAGGDDAVRGRDGPIQVDVPDRGDLERMADALISAGEAAGYPHREDYNGADQEGFTRMQFSMAGGRRRNSAATYLRPALARTNLKLETGAEVSRILFDGNRATGIEYRRGDRVMQANGSEVILSAGAYNSPKLLMLSGIGPADHLNEMGIEVVEDRAGVGANLQDHPCFPTEYTPSEPTQFEKDLRFDRLFFNMVRAQLFRSGPAAIPMGLAAGFIKSRPELDAPDLQMPFRNWSTRSQPWFPFIRPSSAGGLGFMVVHIQPESRGTVRLRSPQCLDAPRIDNNFLSTTPDRAALRDGFKIARRLIEQPALAAFVTGESMPGPDVQSDDEIDGHVRQFLGTMFHPVGSCRMGTDPDSVVDQNLRVRKIENLRVADASVMPTISRGNTNAPTMMIAEKAADLILGKHT